MVVTFYNISDDPRKLEKTLAGDKQVTCSVYGECSMLAPSLLLKYDPELAGKNYMYIPEWSRYYFIDNFTVDSGQRCVITGSVDVLMSYAESIKKCTGNCVRNEGIGSPTDVPDGSFPIKPSSNFVTTLSLGNLFDENELTADKPHYLLSTK